MIHIQTGYFVLSLIGAFIVGLVVMASVIQYLDREYM